MGRIGKTLALLLVLVFLTSLVLLPHVTVEAQTRTLVVPDQYPTIQLAIGNASAGDTVFVKAGVYNGTLYIDKSLSLIGENSQKTVITASGFSFWNRYIIVMGSGITISNFTILGSDLSGIYASGGLNNDLSDCKIIGNNLINAGIVVDDGVYVFAKTNPINKPLNVISGNNITGSGISVGASNTEVSDNNIANNPYDKGIVAYYASNVTLKGNYISNSAVGGIALGPWGPYSVYNNSITNSISGTGTAFGIQFQHCTNATVYSNNITNNDIGVSLQNYALYNYSNSPYNYSATVGSENKFYNNKVINNTRNAVVEHAISNDTINGEPIGNATDIVSWDNGKIGNYWSDYNGNGNYVIDENNIDYYPQTQPHQNSIDFTLPIGIIAIVLAVSLIILLLYRRHRRTSIVSAF